MPEITVVRYRRIYDFRGHQVGDHSIGSFFGCAEFTWFAGDFIQAPIDLHTNMRLLRPRGPFGAPVIGRAHNA